ncbi:hypothetical protein AQ779_16175 [Burkholderia pseudomallei]|nr:hypothetical protein UQ47_16220 [Burkholderia pseudomallei]ALB14680.1 hypothetical protein ACT79_30520 [Burkholderia pseudomallei]KIX37467.1 hypothetical protein SZ28_18830 [Burkholderia pseudomallei]KIX60200.1 hypothetical protein SZ31_15305 [Burkholderia pseudomallei]OAB14675.1 hypothetical protein AQ846_14675 [Burkholderia pseudomallei]
MALSKTAISGFHRIVYALHDIFQLVVSTPFSILGQLYRHSCMSLESLRQHRGIQSQLRIVSPSGPKVFDVVRIVAIEFDNAGEPILYPLVLVR